MADAPDFDRAGPGQPARAAQQVDAPARQPALLAGIGIVRHHEVPPGQRGCHVDLRARADVARALHRLARAQQRLRRNTRPVRAFPADQLPLHDGDTQPARSQRRGTMLPRRPAAEDNHVIVPARAHRFLRRSLVRPGTSRPDDDHVVVAYVGSSVPACSATMYLAYQSGQFASASPMRFSCSPWAAEARRIASARSLAEPNEVTAGSTRPGSRVVTSWNSHPLPSGSLNETNEP